MNVVCKQSRNDKRSLSVMMGENSGQRPLLSWEQRWFVSAIRSLIPLGPQVPTEANKCVRDSPRDGVAWAQAGQTWVPVLAACLPSDHREVTGPVRAFIFPSVKRGGRGGEGDGAWAHIHACVCVCVSMGGHKHTHGSGPQNWK